MIERGHRFGPYEISSPLGEGGMGEVYRARDTRLDRSVAIKVFKQAFTERFEREARAISALNHPHICTLHDIGREGDTRFLVMELIEGEPLAGPMPVEQALHYALQILDALQVAHRAGIIHRDLKPANILRTKAGVKLLDFGLAKRSLPDSTPTGATLTMHASSEQLISGTLQYMAPEQLEGREADARTDIFAFGCVLYEMLTGHKVFPGDSAASVIAAVMSTEPRPVSDVGETAGLALELVIRRCLERRPEDRWQTVQDLQAALRLLTLQAGVHLSAPSPPARLPRWLLAALPVLFVAGAVTGWLIRSRQPARKATADYALHPLTLPEGSTFAPAWSPDGRFLFYAALRNGNLDIYRRATDRGEETQITSSPANETDPAVSPDGRMVALSSDQDGGGIFLAPSDGGVPARITSFGAHPVWSPDGKQIAFDWSGAVYLVAPSGGEPRQILAATGDVRPYMVWAAGGARMLLWHRVKSDIVAFDIQSRQIEPLGLVPPGYEVSGISLGSDGKTLAFSSGPMGGNKDLYRVDLDPETLRPQDRPQRVTLPLTDDAEVRLNPDGIHIAFVVRDIQRHLYALPLDPKTGRVSGAPQQITTAGQRNYYPAVSPDGQVLVWTSQSGDNGMLYFRRFDAPDVHKLTQDWETGAREVLAAFSPDSQQIAYASTSGGPFRIWRMPSLQSVSLLITESEVQYRDTWPTWSADGKQIAFHSNRGGNFDIWIVSPDGANRRRITDWPSNELRALFAPDGRTLGFNSDRSGNGDIWGVDVTTGKMRPLVEHPADEGPFAWSPDGTRLYFLSTRGGRQEIWMQAAEGAPAERVLGSTLDLALSDDPNYAKFAIAPGRLIVPLEARRSRIQVLERP